MITEEGLRELRDKIDEMLQDSEREEWPYDKMLVPINPDNMNEDDWEQATKAEYTPPYGLKFRMPNDANDFPCHKCGEDTYGPWIHKDMFHHGVFDRSIGEERIRRCRNCGHIHYNAYSIGEYSVEQADGSTVLRLKDR